MPGAIVGYCVASEDANSAHLVSIGVLLEYRRRGVGTALLQKLLASLNPRVKELWLEVKQSNSEAVMLYKELGFKQVDFIENYYEDGSTALKMVLSRKDEHTVRSGGKVK
jgi:ribosomal-protein-alanine N-acetyltransferase